MDQVKKLIKDWVIPLAIAVLLAKLVNFFVFFNILVPTESMYPTIKVNDRILVSRIYNMTKLKRGDVIVFYSKELKEPLIKRLIGLSGDSIEIKNDGKVYVNGEELDESYVVNKSNLSGKYTVPENSYFFLGDNRANSLDSRYWDNPFISEDDIKGKAQYIIFPFKHFGKL